MASIKYEKLIELIQKNPDFIEYDSEVDPKSHLVILFESDVNEKDIEVIEIVEGHAIMDSPNSTIEISIGEDDLVRKMEFR
jgi:hypothetical protein